MTVGLRMMVVGLAVLTMGSGCKIRQNMYDQPKFEPYEKTDFFGDSRSARPLVEGTVAQGWLNEDEHLYTGKIDGELATEPPFPVTHEVLARGQQRYNIYCLPCHGPAGHGDGMVVQRGYKKPSSYHIDRLRDMPDGYFFDVISNGFGVMPSYSYQVREAEDRWAIVAYIRALQLSQHAVVEELPEEDQQTIQAM